MWLLNVLQSPQSKQALLCDIELARDSSIIATSWALSISPTLFNHPLQRWIAVGEREREPMMWKWKRSLRQAQGHAKVPV